MVRFAIHYGLHIRLHIACPAVTRGLLDANFAADPTAPMFLAGGWHDEDFSQSGVYDTQPFGITAGAYTRSLFSST